MKKVFLRLFSRIALRGNGERRFDRSLSAVLRLEALEERAVLACTGAGVIPLPQGLGVVGIGDAGDPCLVLNVPGGVTFQATALGQQGPGGSVNLNAGPGGSTAGVGVGGYLTPDGPVITGGANVGSFFDIDVNAILGGEEPGVTATGNIGSVIFAAAFPFGDSPNIIVLAPVGPFTIGASYFEDHFNLAGSGQIVPGWSFGGGVSVSPDEVNGILTATMGPANVGFGFNETDVTWFQAGINSGPLDFGVSYNLQDGPHGHAGWNLFIYYYLNW